MHFGVREAHAASAATDARVRKYLARALKAYRDVNYFEAVCNFAQVSHPKNCASSKMRPNYPQIIFGVIC